MKKALIAGLLALVLSFPVFFTKEAKAEMDEVLLKCLLSGICPGEEQTVRTAGVIIEIEGDVEYSSDLGQNFQPLTNGETVKTGYRVSTGFESYVTIDFGFGEIRVPPMTQFTIEKFETSEQLRQMQVALFVGSVKAKVKHTDAIRSDFSVRSTPSLSSIRGSEMQVEVMKNLSVVTSAIEGTAYVQGILDVAETKLSEGNSVTISAEGRAGTPIKTSAGQIKNYDTPAKNTNLTNSATSVDATTVQDSPSDKTGPVKFWYYLGGGAILVAVVSAVFVLRRRRG